ncbi:MAG: hypothetical protein HON65_03530 [Rhodospirillales bacterium]|jgi:flagellin|nr:hypothetical protein [Rhodospirillales bacterium]
MDEINLTSSIRENLLSLQHASQVREQSAQHLATGRKVNSAVEEPASFFAAKGLLDRAQGLAEAKDDIDQAISAVEAASVGTEALSEIAKQMRGIAMSARGGTDEQRQAASERYDALRNQLDQLAKDITYNGVNVVKPESDDLEVDLSESGSFVVTIEGQDSGAEGLAINTSSFYNNFATDEDIDGANAQLREATQTLRSNAASLGSDVALLSDRKEFVVSLSNTLEDGAAKLVVADMNEEAATQLSSQLRQQLSLSTLQVTGEHARSLTQLMS